MVIRQRMADGWFTGLRHWSEAGTWLAGMLMKANTHGPRWLRAIVSFVIMGFMAWLPPLPVAWAAFGASLWGLTAWLHLAVWDWPAWLRALQLAGCSLLGALVLIPLYLRAAKPQD